MAPAHARPGPAFDPVQGFGSQSAVDGVHNLPFGDLFTAADDVAVQRIFFDVSGPLLMRLLRQPQRAPAGGGEVRFFCQAQLVRYQTGHIVPNGRRAGKPRGFNARRLKEAVPGLPQKEVIPGLVGPQAHKGGDDLPHGHSLHGPGGFFRHFRQPGGGGGGLVQILHIGGGGAHQQVAVDRGADQHALAHFTGQLENGPAHMAPSGFVQQAVFALAGSDRDFFLKNLVVQFTGMDPGGIYHSAGPNLPRAGLQKPAIRLAFDLQNLRVKTELHSVAGGAFRQAQGQLKGAYHAGGPGQQGPADPLRQVGLQGPCLLPGEQGEPRYAVGQPPVVQSPQLGQLRWVQADHQSANALKGNIQLLGELVHFLVA